MAPHGKRLQISSHAPVLMFEVNAMSHYKAGSDPGSLRPCMSLQGPETACKGGRFGGSVGQSLHFVVCSAEPRIKNPIYYM